MSASLSWLVDILYPNKFMNEVNFLTEMYFQTMIFKLGIGMTCFSKQSYDDRLVRQRSMDSYLTYLK